MGVACEPLTGRFTGGLPWGGMPPTAGPKNCPRPGRRRAGEAVAERVGRPDGATQLSTGPVNFARGLRVIGARDAGAARSRRPGVAPTSKGLTRATNWPED